MRILLIEDDPVLADGLGRCLQQNGFSVDWCHDGADADHILRTQEFDLVILDLTLPGLDGLEVLESLRSRQTQFPVLITTARSDIQDRIKGLDLGADDYLTKPFDLREFEARVRALLRRSKSKGLEKIEVGDVAFDINTRRVFVKGTPIDLPKRELNILDALISRQGRLLTKDQIIEQIARFDDDLSPSAIEIYVSRLRKKLEPGGLKIKTVRGLGYMIE